MLNRRILRIKVLQALYGYFLTRDSLLEIAQEELLDQYALDPAIHDFSDSDIFASRQEKIREALRSKVSGKKTWDTRDLDKEVIEEINAKINTYLNDLSAEKRRVRKAMLREAHVLYDAFIKLLLLPEEFRVLEQQAKDKDDAALVTKKVDWHFNLLKNKVLTDLATTKEIVAHAVDHRVDWNNEREEVRQWYRDIVCGHEAVTTYQQNPDPSEEEHRNLLIALFKRIIFKKQTLDAYFGEQDLHWSENRSILKGMILKSLKTYDPESEQKFELKTLSLNQEDDFHFFEHLFDETLSRNDELEDIIRSKARNWDLSRIAHIDMIILKLAITEMICFPSIPVKVTINEFIDISKVYSTPKSKQFINGILDVLANELTSEGVIKKSGRGLIDNK